VAVLGKNRSNVDSAENYYFLDEETIKRMVILLGTIPTHGWGIHRKNGILPVV
jgi:hypothetical protein